MEAVTNHGPSVFIRLNCVHRMRYAVCFCMSIAGTLEPLCLHTRLTILLLHKNTLLGTRSHDLLALGFSSVELVCSTYIASALPAYRIVSCDFLPTVCVLLHVALLASGGLQTIANLTSLTDLTLSDNQLDGALDPLANMTKLTELDVSRNRFSGTVCALARMTKVISLAVGGNILTGNVSCLRNLTALQVQLDVSSNRLDGSLDVLPSFPQLLILNASHNTFSGLVVPHVVSAALTRLALVDVSWNSFTDCIESLAPFSQATSLTRLLLVGNLFVGSRLLLDLERLPRLVELDLSDNSGVTGLLTQTAAPGRSMVLTAAGKTRFACPTPPFPSTMIVTFSACRQLYDGMLALLGYVAAGAAAVGLIVYLTKLYQHPRFLHLVASGMWLAGCLSFLNDGRLLLEMVTTVTGKTTNCDIVNQRGVFETFLPLRDTGGFTGLRSEGYIGPRGPYCFCGNETFFPGSRQLDLRFDPPPREQTFVEYMTVYTLWSPFASSMSPLLQRAAFHDLCLRFPRCNLAPGSNDQVCGDRYDDSWPNKDNFGFLVCVVTLLVWRGVLEALKLAVIVASFVKGRIVGREYAMPFLQSSPFLPLMGALGIDWVGDVLRYQRKSKDHLRFFAVQGLLNALPFLALQLFFVNVVQQTGLDTLSYLSLVINFFLVPVIASRSAYAFLQERTSHVSLVASIVAHSRRSSTASDASDSVSTVDVEMTSMSSNQSLTWRPLDLSNSASATLSGPVVAAATGSASEDLTGAGGSCSKLHPVLQLAVEASAAVASVSVHANHDAVSLEDRTAASGVDAFGLFPAGALKSDSSDQI
jgi:hypothetical protein